MGGEWEDVTPVKQDSGWEDVAPKRAQGVPVARGARPLPANAGVADLLASMAGLPMDTVQNVANIGIAGYGAAKAALTGQPGPDLMTNIPGGSENIRNMLRSTGAPGLSPDNPTPESKMGTRQYEFVRRGGVIPGGVLAAGGSMIAEKLGGPQWGMVGAMTPAAISAGVREIPRPAMTPEKQLLAKEGVSMTPGQIIGGAARRLEDAATSIPFLGDSIKAAQRRGVESFNSAAINRSLEPIGDVLPKHLKGREALEYARSKLGDAYDSLLPNLKGDLNAGYPGGSTSPVPAGQTPPPASFQAELNNIRQMGQNLPRPQQRQLDRIIANEVENRFTSSGLASGDTLKNIESELGRLSKDFRRSDNYDTRTLGKAVEEVQAAMRRMVENVNPAYQGELAKINEGYANFKKVQSAGADIGALNGVFSPAQLQRAVRRGDTTKDKRAFSEGDALMQDLSEAGKQVLAPTVPDSGTPFRTAMREAISHPLKASVMGAPIAAGAAMYSSPAQAALQSFLTKQQATRQPNLQELIQQAIIANQGTPK